MKLVKSRRGQTPGRGILAGNGALARKVNVAGGRHDNGGSAGDAAGVETSTAGRKGRRAAAASNAGRAA